MASISSEPMAQKTRWIWFGLICIVVVGIDQWSKFYALENWQGVPPRSFFNDLFRIQFAPNEGAFLGLFGNLPDHIRFLILKVINGIVLVAVAGYILFGKNISRYIFVAFAMVVAGGIGNMIDRIRFDFVVDFFNLGIGGLRTGIFNVADMAITAGFFMMIPLVIWGDGEASPKTEKIDSTTEAAPS